MCNELLVCLLYRCFSKKYCYRIVGLIKNNNKNKLSQISYVAEFILLFYGWMCKIYVSVFHFNNFPNQFA